MSLRTLFALPALFALLAAVGCDDTGNGPDGPAPVPSSTGTTAPVSKCVAPTGAGTLHKGDVKDGEVWTAAASPHIVEYDVVVRNGAKLTIEPCAIVKVASRCSSSR